MAEANTTENETMTTASTQSSVYRSETESEVVAKEEAKPARKSKPTHYKVVCISLYTQDIEHLEETVAELKRRGHTKANKSQLIRQALRQFDIEQLPPPQL